jgi:TolB-like protein
MENQNTLITPLMVKEALFSILNSDEFRNSHILARFLEFVVLEKLSCHEDEIKEYTIGIMALGRPPDFNPQLDAIVRIHAGRLRRALFHYYTAEGKDNILVITIPKGSYVPVFSFRNSEKENRLHDHNFGDSTERSFTGETLTEHQAKPILAVFPFTNLSSEDSKDFFVSGMGEQISIDLARFQNISVISYYATNNYKPVIAELRELRKITGLDYALLGSVRFINSTVRLNIQLILAENGTIVWTDSYNRHYTPENVFEIQEDVAGQVLNAIADDNGVIVKINKANASTLYKTETMKIQDGIYKYYDYASNYSPKKFVLAIEALETAIRIEPNNALATGLLSELYLDIYATNINQDYQILEKAMMLAQKAVALDQHCQQAQKSLAWGHLFFGNKESSVEQAEACINLNPKSASINSAMGLALVCAGEYAKGLKYLLKAKQLNPSIHHTCKLGLALFYYYSNKLTESLHWLMQMQPLEFPFIKLLHTAIHGKINGKVANLDQSILKLKDNVHNIISRLLMDNKIKKEITRGLNLAGFPF